MLRREARSVNDPRQPDSSIYEFSGYRLDVARRQLRSSNEQPANLTVKVFDILLYLVQHHGEVVEKSALMQAVWPNVVPVKLTFAPKLCARLVSVRREAANGVAAEVTVTVLPAEGTGRPGEW